MTEFDPERFEEKYVHYLDELQRAYRNAYRELHGRYDSELLRVIDRRVLDESEPFYEGGSEFRVALPADTRDRVGEIPVDDETFEEVLREFVERIESELARIFGFDPEE